MDADDIIAKLGLQPHPEGGWYRQTWVAAAERDARPAGTAILFLLKAGERSHWHRIDADEIWHFHAGAPLALSLAQTAAGPAVDKLLGADLAAGQSPQAVVPAHHWQAARTTGDWTLVGCTVSPGFRFEGFELAPPDFHIPHAPEDAGGLLSRHFADRRGDWYAPIKIGATPASANEGARLILDGIKTATSSAPWEIGEVPPFPGALSVLLDGEGRPRAVVETVAVRPMRFGDADEALARDYGEGDRTLAWWRREMGDYYRAAAKATGAEFGADTVLVVEWFRVVWREG
jgi:hypothetical protein